MSENLVGLSVMVSKRYLDLKNALIDLIERGQPGDQLPSQRDLCERYAVSHMTTRRAINELTQAGRIDAVAGKGLYIASPKQQAESDPLIGFQEDMAQRGLRASSRILNAERISASPQLAATLATDADEPLIRLRRLRLTNDQPMAIQDSYLVALFCPDLLTHDLERGSLFQTLRTVYGLNLASGVTTVEALIATKADADLLGLSRPAALLVTEQITYLADGRAIEFVRSVYRADRYRLRMPNASLRGMTGLEMSVWTDARADGVVTVSTSAYTPTVEHQL